ncbi:Outer membrane cobalamin receptor protein [Tenacibaculum mesophilum]|uniref:TonB-dependent receptor n=1 Tax=Tenacibaculum mesophilum TaxID=104268 RepID=A0ABM7CEV9_9FLAO|nr:TonB-dependent receptor [Tenacibaculum mesophilum]AZJ32288.1 TonB-dependent receptor [Tenacibaculum mesophilum]QFS27544.1 TonB-dependent receptor plug domain-containing protein [Tenacibaculum mesophilum]SHG11102.1 Outer membrane cobalamin receptor protein [Tenacibaculum mesophilum]
MKHLLLIVCFLTHTLLIAQTTIKGKVTDTKGNPIEGANVYLEGTYDGTSSDEKGNFSFTTSEEGEQTLTVSFISFETYIKTAEVSTFKNLKIILREDVNTLDSVTINAGTFEAGDNAKVTALKPLDVVTTASALGDFVGALQTLPGTSSVSEDGRLFVRGGEAEETQIFIDGARVFTPYSPSARNIPTRGRFSPFLFKGITFSTGGYSAEYGQALSSVLLLNTNDEAVKEKTDISLMTVGLGVGNTQIFGKNSLSVNASYINLAPYQKLFPDRNTWNKPVQSLNGEAVYRFRFKNESLLKLYGAYSYTDFDMIQEDINYEDGFRFGLKNRNLYFNGSYKQHLTNNWTVTGGASFTNDNSKINILDDKVVDNENSAHVKATLKKRFSNRFKLNFGAEYFITDFSEDYSSETNGNTTYGVDNNIFGSFIEADIFFSKKLATKVGVRMENSELLDEFTISPRASIAYKPGENAQFSFAYGRFYQNPKNEYLKFNMQFKAENTSHFIANYQYVKNKQILRIEGYYKKYQDLVKYDNDRALSYSNFSNLGEGYSKGIDIFWRDNKNVKSTDYWVSYSFLDTERDYKNYPVKATPNFASKHNLSVVAKHWIADWKSQVGMSYNFASGRSYTNPNKGGFLNQKTKNYNSVSLNWAYLISQQKILYFSVNNVLGTQNVFGYNYKNTPNPAGTFNRQAIIPSADSFFFVGFFWTISDNKKDNQLNNL